MAIKLTAESITEMARDVFDNSYDDPFDLRSFDNALAQVFLRGMQEGIRALPGQSGDELSSPTDTTNESPEK